MGEISELVLKAKGDDSTAFEELLHRYEPMIISLASKYSDMLQQADKDDFVQEAKVAFYNAIVTYNLSENKVTFGAYAKVCVRNRLISCVRKLGSKKRRKDISSNEEYGDTPQDSAIYKEAGEELISVAQSCLSPYEMKIFGYYLNGEKTKDIALKVSKSAKSVNNAIFRIKAKLKRIVKKGT